MRFNFRNSLKICFQVVFPFFLVCGVADRVFAKDDSTIDFYQPTFRSGHNVSAFLTEEYINWYAAQNQAPTGTDSTVRALKIDTVDTSKLNMGLYFRYAYHINIISNFGFFVGSTTGMFMPFGIYGVHRNFTPGLGLALPSVLGGLVLGLGPNYRMTGGAEYGAIYFPMMKIYTEANDQKVLSPTSDMINAYIQLEKNFHRDSLYILGFGYRKTFNPQINGGNDSVYTNSLTLRSKGWYMQVGLNWLIEESSY